MLLLNRCFFNRLTLSIDGAEDQNVRIFLDLETRDHLPIVGQDGQGFKAFTNFRAGVYDSQEHASQVASIVGG